MADEPAKITNRNKKPTADPAILEVINSNEPIIEPTPDDEVVIPDAPEIPAEPIVEPPEIPDEPKKPVTQPKAPETDYKEKYRESSKEALTQYFKNQKLTETIDEAANLPEPTDDEVRAYAKETGAEYDDLDDLTIRNSIGFLGSCSFF